MQFVSASQATTLVLEYSQSSCIEVLDSTDVEYSQVSLIDGTQVLDELDDIEENGTQVLDDIDELEVLDDIAVDGTQVPQVLDDIEENGIIPDDADEMLHIASGPGGA